MHIMQSTLYEIKTFRCLDIVAQINSYEDEFK